MKISITIDFDPQTPGDLPNLKRIIELLESNKSPTPEKRENSDIEKAWRTCSWEVITFALAVLYVHDGDTDKGIYAYFDNLCKPENQQICGHIVERGISSRVGRTAVICKKMGDKFRLMSVGTRRNDGLKRAYITYQAREALLNLLRTDWRRELEVFMKEKELLLPDLDQL